MFEKPTRNHFTVIFERLGGFFVAILVIVLSNMQGNADANMFSADFWRNLGETAQGIEDYYYIIGVIIFFAVIAVVLAISFRFWRKTVFYIEDGYLIYERNTLYRKKSKLPIDIISTVNLERNIFERIVGTAKVKLDINSAQTSNATDFTLVLSMNTAQSFKETVTSKKSESTAEKTADTEAPQVIIAFTPAQVVRHIILSLPIMQGIIAIIAFSSQFIGDAQEGGSQLKYMLIFTLVCGAFAVVTSILNTLDYTVSADEENFYITKGRLKKVSYTFSCSRINAVFVKQPLLARIFGMSSVEVAVIGLGNEKNETPSLCLLSDKTQTQRILDLCAADFSKCTGETMPQCRAALIPSAFCLAVVTALSLLVLLIPQASVAWVVIASVITITAAMLTIAYRTKSIRFDGKVFHCTHGIFTKRTGMFRYDRIQGVEIQTNFIMNRKNAEKMNWSILSGAAMKAHTSGWFSQGIFESVAEKTVEAADASTQLF